jgi:hypothetical protein
VHEVLALAKFDNDVADLGDVAADSCGLTVNQRAYPILDVTIRHSRPLRLRMNAPNWDDQPPGIELLNPDGSPLAGTVPGGIFHPGPHPSTGRPFICMRGSLEFHTYPGHVNESWAQYRGQDGMGLIGIVMQIADNWREQTR